MQWSATPSTVRTVSGVRGDVTGRNVVAHAARPEAERERDEQQRAEREGAGRVSVRARDREAQRAETMRMLRRMAALPQGDPERARLRTEVIRDHMAYARHLARHYARYDGTAEDLEQVAYLGLVKSVDQFDPEHGTGFLGYATPMILGEIKRHFRDGTWSVHVPRRLQELSGAMYRARDDLRVELEREPTVAELAERLGVEVDQAVAALDAADAYHAASLDHPIGHDDDAGSLGDRIGREDPGFDHVVDHEVLRGLMARLSERDKRILLMRFFRGMTQQEIGQAIGVSQMQVSRLLSRIIGRLREGFDIAEA